MSRRTPATQETPPVTGGNLQAVAVGRRSSDGALPSQGWAGVLKAGQQFGCALPPGVTQDVGRLFMEP